MKPRYLVVTTLAVVTVLFASAAVFAQTAARDAAELGRRIDEQQAEIEKLRDELRQEAAMRRQQQELLETVLARLTALTATADEAAARPQTAAATAVPAATPEAPKAQPTPVQAGLGRIRMNGTLQTGFVASDRGINDTFRVRRAELRFTGDIMPNVRWTVMFDLAKALSLRTTTTTVEGTTVIRTVEPNQASRIFQEAFITLTHLKRANFQIGQFKVPLSQEGLQSVSTLDTVERALFMSDRSRGGALGDVRDIGVMAFGPLGGQFEYQAGIFNGLGESQNDLDQNEQKSVAGRFVFKPSAVKGLQLGASGAATVGGRFSAVRRDRAGAEAVYTRDRLRLKGEAMFGTDGDIHRRGYYAHFGYRVLPKLETVFRYDVFDPDTRRETLPANVTERDYLAGLNYFIKGHNVKLQMNYIRKTFAHGIAPSRNVFLANLQTAW